jgi:transposase
MRYPQGGGLTAERRAVRERLRLQAAGGFARGEDNRVIARQLRVSVRSVQRWRKAWKNGGPRALHSKGPASLPVLSDEQFAVLERELARGPAAHGWPDQKWTLARIKTVIGGASPQLHHPGDSRAAAPAPVELAGAGPPRHRTRRPGRDGTCCRPRTPS